MASYTAVAQKWRYLFFFLPFLLISCWAEQVVSTKTVPDPNTKKVLQTTHSGRILGYPEPDSPFLKIQLTGSEKYSAVPLEIQTIKRQPDKTLFRLLTITGFAAIGLAAIQINDADQSGNSGDTPPSLTFGIISAIVGITGNAVHSGEEIVTRSVPVIEADTFESVPSPLAHEIATIRYTDREKSYVSTGDGIFLIDLVNDFSIHEAAPGDSFTFALEFGNTDSLSQRFTLHASEFLYPYARIQPDSANGFFATSGAAVRYAGEGAKYQILTQNDTAVLLNIEGKAVWTPAEHCQPIYYKSRNWEPTEIPGGGALQYLDSEWKSTTYNQAVYYRNACRAGQIITRYMSGAPFMSGNFVHIDPHHDSRSIRNGHFSWFFPDGGLMQEGRYVYNIPDSIHNLYYPGQKIRAKMHWKMGKLLQLEIFPFDTLARFNLNDPMTSNRLNWACTQGTESLTFSPQGMTLSLESGVSAVVFRPFLPDYSKDFEIGVTLCYQSGMPQSGFGLMCSYEDFGHFTAFLISADGGYALMREDGQNSNALKPWTNTAAVAIGNTPNRLRVVKLDTACYFFLNENFLFSTPATPSGPNLGIYTGESLIIRVSDFYIKGERAP